MKRDAAKGDDAIVGRALAEVLPKTDKYWFQQPHLLKLNLVLLVPMLSSSVFGYDGTLPLKLAPFNSVLSTEHSVANVRVSFPHERSAVSSPVERLLWKSDRSPPRHCYCLPIDRLTACSPNCGRLLRSFWAKAGSLVRNRHHMRRVCDTGSFSQPCHVHRLSTADRLWWHV